MSFRNHDKNHSSVQNLTKHILKKEAETELCRRKDLKPQDIFRPIRKNLTHFNTAAVIC